MTTKTSLSISVETRELLRGMADFMGITMEQAMFKAVDRYASSMIHNPNNADAYNALQALSSVARQEMEARRNVSGRSRHMQKINRERQQARKEDYDASVTLKNRHGAPITTPYGVFGKITEHKCEISDMTRRRMIGIDASSMQL